MADYGYRVDTTMLGKEDLSLLSHLEVVAWLNEATKQWAIQEPHKGTLRRLLEQFEVYAYGHFAVSCLKDEICWVPPDGVLRKACDLLTEGLIAALNRAYDRSEESVTLALAIIHHELSEIPEDLRPAILQVEVPKDYTS